MFQAIRAWTVHKTLKTRILRWSETKKLEISIPDNIFSFYLIIIKLCTLKQLENIHQKLKLKFS